MNWRPRLSTILLIVNLAVIALPLGGLFFARIYENQLIQETERELISQAAVIGAVFRADLAKRDEQTPRPHRTLSRKTGAVFTPINPQLDLAHVATLPARPDGLPPASPPSPASLAAGRHLSQVLEEAQLTTLIGVRVMDQFGTTIGGTGEIGLSFAHVAEVRTALDGHYASALRYRELKNAPTELSSLSRGTGVRVFVAMPVVSDARVVGVVYLSRTPKSILRHMYEEREKAILALLTVIVLAGSLALLTSATISRPVAELLDRTRQVTSGSQGAMTPLKRPGTREIAQLSEGISQMAQALTERAEYIRTLATHVSHEFKTPLASIQGAAELLEDHQDAMTPAERQRFLSNISADGARLRNLLDRLLDLARAENTQRGEGLVNIAQQSASVLAAAPETLDVEWAVPDGLTAQISQDAFGIVLGNLLENAAQHGAGTVSVTAAADKDTIILTIRDDGDGISPANAAKVFDHFFTTRRDVGGTGLGLGIVRALLSAHGGAIMLAPGHSGEGGACFHITLRR